MSNNTERVLELIDQAQQRAADTIKHRFLADYRQTARSAGFDLDAGDVALVHESDVPQAVTLIRGRDPVWVNSNLVEPGKVLLVDRKLKSMPLYSGLNS